MNLLSSNSRGILAVIAALCLSAAGARAADVYLSLSAHGQRTEIGLSGLVPENQTLPETKLSRQIGDVLRYDLLFSRYFNLTEEGPLYTGKEDELKDWDNRGVNVLISGSVRLSGSELAMTGRLIDVGSRLPIWEKTFRGPADEYRRLAHEMNDEIIQRFTGEKGIAHTKIAFSCRRSSSKELYVIDYDGANLRQLTQDNSIALLPRWSPDAKELIFTTYRYGNPDLYALSLSDKSRRAISEKQGLNTAASFAPDGSKIALTISRGHYPNIYLITRTGEPVRRLTSGSVIDTSPSFAPNGQEIVFVSDRPGLPQMYIMNLEGGNVRRLSTPGYCDSPAWSPRGDKIAFTMRLGRDNYDIYVYDLASSRILRLTQHEGDNENPSWAPDGRFLVFSSTRTGRSELYIIAADGSGVRKLADIPGSAGQPSWSQ